MTIYLYANGTGGTVGDELVTETELYASELVYFVHHTGDDANAGSARQKPWASLVHAIATIGANTIVVLLDGHTETIAAPQTIALSGVKIVGEGSDNGVPTVELTSSLTSQSMLLISGTNVALGNIRVMGGSTQATGDARVAITGERAMVRGCYFECDAGLTDGAALSYSIFARGTRIFETKFVATSTTTQPFAAIVSQGAADCELEAVTIDGGGVGFSAAGFLDYSLLALNAAPTNLRCQQMRLLNGASFGTGEDTTGYVGLSEKSGAVVVSGFARRLASGFQQTGDAMLADIEFYMSGTPLYVHYGTGNDANNGQDELNPKKTIDSALTVATDDCDIIVLLPSHVEPVISEIAVGSIGITIVGCGTSDGKPTCRLYFNAEGPDRVINMGVVSYLRNVWISETTSEVAQIEQALMGATYTEIRGCLFHVGYQDHIGIDDQNSLTTIRETKVESTGTGSASRAGWGLLIDADGALSDIDVRGCEFSNGMGGFVTLAFEDAKACSRIYVIGMTQSFGADVALSGSTTGLVNPETASGSASVNW